VAVNLAAAAAAAAPAGSPTPILVDADMPFGDVAIGLGLDPTHSLADATGADLDETRLRTLLINAPNAGVRTLLAPPDPARAEVVTSADVSRTLEACRQLAPLVVVDTSSSFDEVTLSILEAADHVVLVSTTDVASVKNAKVAVDTLRRLDIAQSHVHLVLNRVPARPLLPVGDVERVLGSTALCVPEDEAVTQAAHEGKALVRATPRSKAGRALTRLAVQFEELVPTPR
jgi:pilus assembly protein CpaE